MKAIPYGFYNTPPLWKNQQFGIQQFDFPEWEGNSTTVVELPTNLRLGHQMEHVFKHLVIASGQFEVVLSNLHIEEGKLRVGELDFILRDIKRNTNVRLSTKMINLSRVNFLYNIINR